MQSTSEKYKQILLGEHWFETKVTVGDYTFPENEIYSVETSSEMFEDSTPCAGSAISGSATIKLMLTYDIPKNAKLSVFFRAVNETEQSEWIPNGIYYVDTRNETHTDLEYDIIEIHAYDAMLFADMEYPSDSGNDYPLLDKSMVSFIAANMKSASDPGSGIAVDERTWDVMTAGYTFPLPAGYSMRECLCMIAAAYAGSFIITPEGKLRLVRMFDIPPESRNLSTEDGYKITFGGTRILV